MAQTKKQSLFESFVNILIGYAVSFVSNLIILPLFGFNVSILQNLGIGVFYTIVSICRSYTVRRFFNKKECSSCDWFLERFDGPYYSTECGQSFTFEDAKTPEENDFNHCPFCSKKINEAPYEM